MKNPPKYAGVINASLAVMVGATMVHLDLRWFGFGLVAGNAIAWGWLSDSWRDLFFRVKEDL